MTYATSVPLLKASEGSKYIRLNTSMSPARLTRPRRAQPGKYRTGTTPSFVAAKRGVERHTTIPRPRMRVTQKRQSSVESLTVGQPETDSTRSWASWV